MCAMYWTNNSLLVCSQPSTLHHQVLVSIYHTQSSIPRHLPCATHNTKSILLFCIITGPTILHTVVCVHFALFWSDSANTFRVACFYKLLWNSPQLTVWALHVPIWQHFAVDKNINWFVWSRETRLVNRIDRKFFGLKDLNKTISCVVIWNLQTMFRVNCTQTHTVLEKLKHIFKIRIIAFVKLTQLCEGVMNNYEYNKEYFKNTSFLVSNYALFV